MSKDKKPITIYHLHFLGYPKESSFRTDYYFGSISAIFEHFTIDEIGIQASSLYNFKLDEIENPIYENKKCWIRKSVLLTKAKTNS